MFHRGSCSFTFYPTVFVVDSCTHKYALSSTISDMNGYFTKMNYFKCSFPAKFNNACMVCRCIMWLGTWPSHFNAKQKWNTGTGFRSATTVGFGLRACVCSRLCGRCLIASWLIDQLQIMVLDCLFSDFWQQQLICRLLTNHWVFIIFLVIDVFQNLRICYFALPFRRVYDFHLVSSNSIAIYRSDSDH